MKKVINFLFSMQLAGVLLLALATSMAVATFLENDFGTTAAQVIVYRATWFEILMLLFAINLTGAIFQKRLLGRRKYGAFVFHLSMIIILLGSAITRFIGYEGTMLIREGATSDVIYSENPYLQLSIEKNGQQYSFEDKKLFSPFSSNRFEKDYTFGDEKVELKVLEYVPGAVQTIREIEDGEPILSLMTSAGNSQGSHLLQVGEEIIVPGSGFVFTENEIDSTKTNFKVIDGRLFFVSNAEVYLMSMMDNSSDTLEAGTFHEFNPKKLYSFGESLLVLRGFFPSAEIALVPGGGPANESSGFDALVVELNYKNNTKKVHVVGGKGIIGEPSETEIDGSKFSLIYGSKKIELPFALELTDFQLERYPGSMSPSSYASDVILIDEKNGIHEPRRIYMNNVLNYGGYRFFQSSYDQDEKGTILSVNHDYWGTLVTYFGYFLLALGMVLSFFGKNSRFKFLIKTSGDMKRISQTGKTTVLFILFAMTGLTLSAQHTPDTSFISRDIDKDHAANFGELLVQDQGGRIKPMNTMASELLRKVARKDRLSGLTPYQVLLGMLVNPSIWQMVPMIKVGHPGIMEIIGVDDKYASFNDFIDFSNGSFKLSAQIEEANQKNPSARSKLDNEVIKVTERVNISFYIYRNSMIRVFPKPGDPDNTWLSVNDFMELDSATAGSFQDAMVRYYESVGYALDSGNWKDADLALDKIKDIQRTYGKDVMLSEAKMKYEILYNKLDIFKKLFRYFGLFGLIMLILLFINVLNPKLRFNIPVKILIGILALLFVVHTLGLALRWYISGHAPWSNGYESMIYIAWATMLAGLIFTRRSKITLAITAILTSVILMVAHLNWMDPQITNLVPVLKSYWLVIHVAIITASYSFLGLSALLGFFNLILMNLKNKENFANLNNKIRELTAIIEMSLIVGLVLLSIGTFLGGIWANESWGRYWGWDPKETWALITILVYSFIIHMRLIPGLRSSFAFNFASLIGFASVLMTYFGVNYYLSGLHSYASGDAVPIPTFVYYTLAVIAIVSIMGYINNRKLEKPTYY